MPIAAIQNILTAQELFTLGLLVATFSCLVTASRANDAFRSPLALSSIALGALTALGIFHAPIDNSARLPDLPISTETTPSQGSAGRKFGGRKNGGGDAGGSGIAQQDRSGNGNSGNATAAGDVNEDGDAGGSGPRGTGGAGRANGRVTLATFVAAGKSQNTPRHAFRDCPTCPEMVPLARGYGQFGADAADLLADASEKPQRIVSHIKPFAMGRTEITVAEYTAFAEATRRRGPSCGDSTAAPEQRAVECVSFNDARAYVTWLSHKTGRVYRLPSASEWEYAARGGRDLPFAAGAKPEDRAANIGLNGRRNAPAGALAANGFGLEDMTGNVAELVADCWTPTLANVPGDGRPLTSSLYCPHRTLKDAAWSEPVRQARISARRPIDPAVARPGVGFRVVAEIH